MPRRSNFVPVPDGWQERSVFVAREGLLTFRHFDPYSQALAKLERAHAHDLADVEAMVKGGLVDHERALAFLNEIAPDLYRFPAIDAASFLPRAEAALSAQG